MTHYVILGAGITGLSLAFFLKKNFPEDSVILLEKSRRAGGWIQTIEKDGFSFELGPHSFRGNGPHIAATKLLLADLALDSQILPADPSAKRRLIYHNQKLQSFFSSLVKMLPKMVWHDLFAKPSESDISIYDFFCRHFGKNAAELFGDVMTRGIYAGDMKKLSMKACFPSLWEKGQKHGSLLKAMFLGNKKEASSLPNIFSFPSGLEELTKALTTKLSGELVLEKEATQLVFKEENIEVKCSDGTSYFADRIFSTLPAKACGNLFRSTPLAEELKSLPAKSLTLVSLGWHEEALLPQKAFGYLIPSQEKEDLLGVIFHSSIFPNGKKTQITAMVDDTPAQAEEIAIEAIRRHLKVFRAPDACHLFQAIDAIPQYELGYFDSLSAIQGEIARLSSGRMRCLGPTFGNGVALNDCISTAYREALREGTPS
jgi:oxygen-dependent protoporphyrinogen oxidase